MRQKKELSAILGVPFEAVRVVAHRRRQFRHGNFFPEFAMVAWGSRRMNAVKWTAERTKRLSATMGRDLTVSAELLDADGRFLALRTSNLDNVGARTKLPLVRVRDGDHRLLFRYAVIRAQAVLSTTVPTILSQRWPA